MNQFVNPIRLVKEFKGAALSIMVLLSWSNTPVTRAWLEVHSGYSDKPVSKALYYLREQGFVVKGAGGWILAVEARQLPLSMQQVEEGDRGGSKTTPLQEEDDSEEIRNFSEKNRNFSESGSIIIKDSNKFLNSGVGNNNKKTEFRKNSENEPPGENTDEPDPEELATIKALERRGIMLNKRTSRLIGKISAEDVENVWTDLSRQGKPVFYLKTKTVKVHPQGYLLSAKADKDALKTAWQAETVGDLAGKVIRIRIDNWRGKPVLRIDPQVVAEGKKAVHLNSLGRTQTV